jgi:hypothetical protein
MGANLKESIRLTQITGDAVGHCEVARPPGDSNLVRVCKELRKCVETNFGRMPCRAAPFDWRGVGMKRKRMKGHVDKIIKPVVPSEPEKAQISVPDAEDLYREIRVENIVTDKRGEKAQLKEGAKVDVIVEADSSATTTKADT